jgi:hypothetical protein
MHSPDPDADLEGLMRRWHHTTEYATAAWTEYTALRESRRASDPQMALAHSRWRAAERERRALLKAIEQIEATAAA